MTLTILGGTGFIGSHLARALTRAGVDHTVPARDADLRGRDLGAVIYSIGLTADFRARPLDTVEAHVSRLARLLESSTLTSLTYLSSTRIYRRCPSPATEDASLRVEPKVADDLYDISKIMGEAVALSARCPTRVVRLSNVYGPDGASSNFLASLLRDALVDGEICLRTSLGSWKDYVSVDDVVRLLPTIALHGSSSVYNLASGSNVTHRAVTDRIAALTGCRIRVADGALGSQPPTIAIDRVRDEFGFHPASVLEDLPGLVSHYAAMFAGTGT